MFNPSQRKLNNREIQTYLEEVLIHPLPQVRRELLDYLLRMQRVECSRDYSLTLNLDGNVRVVELAAAAWQRLVKQMLTTPAQPLTLHSLEVQALRDPRCTLLRGSLALGISKSKAQALRKGVQPIRSQVAPVAAIFTALLAGTRKKEVALKFGVTDQTVSNVRSRILDLLLYYAVQQFVDESKVA